MIETRYSLEFVRLALKGNYCLITNCHGESQLWEQGYWRMFLLDNWDKPLGWEDEK